MWSNSNLASFIAITAHWIEMNIMQTPNGPQYELKLHMKLIGFHRVPGHHTGEYIAQAILYILNHLSITSKVSVLLPYHI